MRFLTIFMYTACSIGILHIINFFYLPVHLIRDLLRLSRPLQQNPDTLLVLPSRNRSDALLERLERSSNIHRRNFHPVECHDKKSIQLMVEPEHIRVVILVVVKLGVIMGLHKLRAAEFIHHGRNS